MQQNKDEVQVSRKVDGFKYRELFSIGFLRLQDIHEVTKSQRTLLEIESYSLLVFFTYQADKDGQSLAFQRGSQFQIQRVILYQVIHIATKQGRISGFTKG